MEKDMEILLSVIEENEQSIENVFNIKLSFAIRTYFRIRNILCSLLKIVGILIFFICLLVFILLLLIFFIEFMNLYPLHKSFNFINTIAYNMLSKILSDEDSESKKCLIDNVFKELLRKPAKCDFCRDIYNIDRVANISQSQFLKEYAYSGKPVIVKGATDNWNAKKLFSYTFFQTIYAYSLTVKNKNFSAYSSIFDRKSYSNDEKISILKNSNTDKMLTCQFFNYRTNYLNLEEFLSADIKKFNNSVPWYVGWSNCDPLVSKILREHYSKPYFLPDNSESHNSDWIFMGYPGYGARLHIDFVERPSWQAQLKGRKNWRLKPPHECRLTCPNEIEAIVETGDIIVLDTNLWYHQTEIIGDEISVTVGAEYD